MMREQLCWKTVIVKCNFTRGINHMFTPSIMGCKSFILGSLDHAKRSVVRGLRISSLRGKLAVSKNKRAISWWMHICCIAHLFLEIHSHCLSLFFPTFPILCMLENQYANKDAFMRRQSISVCSLVLNCLRLKSYLLKYHFRSVLIAFSDTCLQVLCHLSPAVICSIM